MQRHIYLYLLTIAAVILTACSSSDDIVLTEESETDYSGNTYMSIALNTGGTASTRATYSEGEPFESYISTDNSIFLFYDAQGYYLTYGNIATSSSGESTWSTASSSSTSTTDYDAYATVVLGPTTSKPTQMLSILNVGSSTAEEFMYVNLDEAFEILTTLTPEYISPTTDEDYNGSDDNPFVMADALLAPDGTLALPTQIDETYIKTTLEEAEALQEDGTCQPIYVEREIAKVKITSYLTNNAATLSATYPVRLSASTATDATATVTVNGWTVNAVNSSGHVLKNYNEDWQTVLDGMDDDSAEQWYDAESGTSHRVFWAVDDNYDYIEGDACVITYDEDDESYSLSYKDGGCFDGLKYYAWNDVSTTVSEPVYYHENTASKAAQENFAVARSTTCVSTILLTGVISLTLNDGSEQDDVFTDGNLYLCNGVFFTKDAVADYIANELTVKYNYYWKVASDDADDGYEYVALSGSDFASLEFCARDASSTVDGTQVDNTGRIVISAFSLYNDDASALAIWDGTTETATLYNSIADISYNNENDYADASSSVLAPATRAALVTSTDLTDETIKALYEAVQSSALFTISTDDDGTETGGLYCFTGGACYYQVPIEHLTDVKNDIDTGDDNTQYDDDGETLTDDDNNTLYFDYAGLVRNSYYTININSIDNLGNAVYDKDEPLVVIPGEDTNYYVTCSISVLKWYEPETQSVDF